ncbi:SGNH/GDSL hydrolase family protein [Fluviibacterium sp. DFM31]|uniref:SGNH/GDSL hydrolase family protein n=1 Tax=Meridianimarinicoccus marinus TaxID=3231483 RepID=A0ABV3L9D3_9RHOB
MRAGAGAGLAALALAAGLAVLLWPRPPGDPADRALTPWEDPARPARILAFGTSLTARGSWPEDLAATLTACLGHPVQMTRVAQNGMGSTWALAQLDRVVAARPDLVLLEFSINDADLLDGVSRRTSRARHAALLDALARDLPDTRVLLMTMSPVAGVVRHLQRPWLGAYYGIYRDLAADHGVGLADLYPRWRVAPADLPDGLHPAPGETAQLAVPVLARMIGAAAGQPACGAGAGAGKGTGAGG